MQSNRTGYFQYALLCLLFATIGCSKSTSDGKNTTQETTTQKTTSQKTTTQKTTSQETTPQKTTPSSRPPTRRPTARRPVSGPPDAGMSEQALQTRNLVSHVQAQNTLDSWLGELMVDTEPVNLDQLLAKKIPELPLACRGKVMVKVTPSPKWRSRPGQKPAVGPAALLLLTDEPVLARAPTSCDIPGQTCRWCMKNAGKPRKGCLIAAVPPPQPKGQKGVSTLRTLKANAFATGAGGKSFDSVSAEFKRSGQCTFVLIEHGSEPGCPKKRNPKHKNYLKQVEVFSMAGAKLVRQKSFILEKDIESYDAKDDPKHLENLQGDLEWQQVGRPPQHLLIYYATHRVLPKDGPNRTSKTLEVYAVHTGCKLKRLDEAALRKLRSLDKKNVIPAQFR